MPSMSEIEAVGRILFNQWVGEDGTEAWEQLWPSERRYWLSRASDVLREAERARTHTKGTMRESSMYMQIPLYRISNYLEAGWTLVTSWVPQTYVGDFYDALMRWDRPGRPVVPAVLRCK